MKIINTGRGAGKTYTLVQWLKEDLDNRVLVTINETRAQFIRNEYHLSRNNVMSVVDARTQFRGRGNKEISIDDFEEVIENLILDFVNAFGADNKVEYITTNIETAETLAAKEITKKTRARKLKETNDTDAESN